MNNNLRVCSDVSIFDFEQVNNAGWLKSSCYQYGGTM